MQKVASVTPHLVFVSKTLVGALMDFAAGMCVNFFLKKTRQIVYYYFGCKETGKVVGSAIAGL